MNSTQILDTLDPDYNKVRFDIFAEFSDPSVNGTLEVMIKEDYYNSTIYSCPYNVLLF